MNFIKRVIILYILNRKVKIVSNDLLYHDDIICIR